MIRVLHTADWHMDAPLRDFSDAQRRELRRAMLDLPGQIADVALREGCDICLIAGDVFDGPYTAEGYEAVYRALERVEMPVFIAPGNHDPYRERSPWVRERWPENVYLFQSNDITAYRLPELDAMVYGAAFTAADCPALLTDFRAECDERHALMVLHGDPTAVSSPYNPVTAAQVREAGLDYVALGHIHAPGRFGAGAGMCAWPGCPMGHGFDETGTKGVLVAEVDEVVNIRFLPMDVPRFFDHSVVAGEDPIGAVESVLPGGGSRDHIRVRLTGEMRQELLDRLRGRFGEYPNLRLLNETVPLGDIWETSGEDSLTGLFFRMLQEATEGADRQTVDRLELAARIGRRILEGREVELP